jgi:hypothetical protein
MVLMVAPAHVHEYEIPLHDPPGLGAAKHCPVTEQPPPVGKAQILSVPQSASVMHGLAAASPPPASAPPASPPASTERPPSGQAMFDTGGHVQLALTQVGAVVPPHAATQWMGAAWHPPASAPAS